MRSLVLLVAIAGASAWAIVRQLPVSEAEAEPAVHGQIQSVALEGRGLPTAALRAALATRAGDQLDETKLDHDRGALATTLAARGYLAAKVQAPHVSFDAGGTAFVTFAIATGPVFHVRSVTVTGASERDAGVVTLVAGEIAGTDRIARASEVLADRLAARGRPTTVAVKLHPDDAAATVAVELVAR